MKPYYVLESELQEEYERIHRLAYYECETVRDFCELGIGICVYLNNDEEYKIIKIGNEYLCDEKDKINSLLDIKCDFIGSKVDYSDYGLGERCFEIKEMED